MPRTPSLLSTTLHAAALIIAAFLLSGCAAGAPAAEPAAVTVDSAAGATDQHDHEEADEHEHDESASGSSEAHREVGAHEHGAATLSLAWSESEMAVRLDTPAYNVFGFEYEPTAEAEVQLVADSLAFLEEGAYLRLNEAAECAVVRAEVAAIEEATEEGDNDHSDVVVDYTLNCNNLDAVRSLDLSSLFAQFPNFENIDVEWVSPSTQSANKATRDAAVIELR